MLLFAFASAQKKELTLKQAVLGQRSEFGVQTLRNISWIPTLPAYSFIKDNILMQNDCKTQKQSTIVTLDELNSKLSAKGFAASKNFPSVVWVTNSTVRFAVESSFVLFDVKQKAINSVISFDKSADDRELSPDNQKVAYTLDNNLFVVNGEGKVSQVTNDTNPGIVNVNIPNIAVIVTKLFIMGYSFSVKVVTKLMQFPPNAVQASSISTDW